MIASRVDVEHLMAHGAQVNGARTDSCARVDQGVVTNEGSIEFGKCPAGLIRVAHASDTAISVVEEAPEVAPTEA